MSAVVMVINEVTGAGDAADAMREGSASAADATLQATQENIEFQEWLWGEQKELMQPFVDTGYDALSQYYSAVSQPYSIEDMYLDPGYQFGLQEGQKAYETSASATGTQLSGKQAKDLTRFGQDYASTKYNEGFNRRQAELSNLYALVSGGQASAAGQAQMGTQMGQQVSSSIMTGGQAMSDMYMQQAQATAAEAMAPWNTVMDIGQLGVYGYGASKMSDIRLKENIKHIGMLPSGLKVYEYNFKGHDEVEQGVMAQEVKQVFPDAVSEVDGYLAVNYSMLR